MCTEIYTANKSQMLLFSRSRMHPDPVHGCLAAANLLYIATGPAPGAPAALRAPLWPELKLSLQWQLGIIFPGASRPCLRCRRCFRLCHCDGCRLLHGLAGFLLAILQNGLELALPLALPLALGLRLDARNLLEGLRGPIILALLLVQSI